MICHFNDRSVTEVDCVVMAYKLQFRKSVYNLVGHMPRAEIVRLFENQNVSRRTVYRAIAECEEGLPCLNLPKSGRPRLLTGHRANWLIESAKNKIGMSLRKLSRRYGVSKDTISRELKRRGIQYRKRKKCPKYTQNQLARIPRCCRALRRTHFANNKVIVIDDEKYFTLSNSEIKGNDGFYTDNVEDCPDNVKYKQKAKFADKVLVWCAISTGGISRPYVGRVRGEALNSESYIRNCLTKLINFIHQNHAQDDIMFWPDLASCHYARETQNWLNAHNIPFVPKNDNPPNLPQARPIEDFWAILSRKVYGGGWEAENEQQLRRRICRKIREIDIETVQGLMRDVPRRLRIVEDHGPLHLI